MFQRELIRIKFNSRLVFCLLINTDTNLLSIIVYYKIMDIIVTFQVRQKHLFLYDNICYYYWAITYLLCHD